MLYQPLVEILAGWERHGLVEVSRAERGLRVLVQLVPLRSYAVRPPRTERLRLLRTGEAKE